jgi:DNA-binding FadR family transcriptional regulator
MLGPMERHSHSNLAQQVLAELGKRIAIDEYAPGNTLPPEEVLIREFGASRTVIREAIKMLAAKGLVSTRPRRGTTVLPESSWNLADPDILDWLLHRRNVLPLILEFAEIRLAVEPAAAALAARVANAAQIEGMRAGIRRMQDAANGQDDPLDADIAFHVAVLRGTQNRFFYSLRYMVEVALRFSIRISNQVKGVDLASIDEHERILDAIAARDADRAERLMRTLILDARAFLYRANESLRVGEGSSR